LAKVWMRGVSDPALGSVTPKHTCRSPSTMRGSVAAFISSEPCLITGCMPKIDMWIALEALWPPPDAAIACIMSAASKIPRPVPPCSSGTAMPTQPASANAL
jgi:hypothetical protein